MINTLFSGNEISKERTHSICTAAICIDSVLRVDKVYVEQCKYKIKRRKPVDFIDDEVNSSLDDSDHLDE